MKGTNIMELLKRLYYSKQTEFALNTVHKANAILVSEKESLKQKMDFLEKERDALLKEYREKLIPDVGYCACGRPLGYNSLGAARMNCPGLVRGDYIIMQYSNLKNVCSDYPFVF